MAQTPVTKGFYQTLHMGLLDIHQDIMRDIHIPHHLANTRHKDIRRHLAHILHMGTPHHGMPLMDTHHLDMHLLVDTHYQVILVLVLLAAHIMVFIILASVIIFPNH